MLFVVWFWLRVVVYRGCVLSLYVAVCGSSLIAVRCPLCVAGCWRGCGCLLFVARWSLWCVVAWCRLFVWLLFDFAGCSLLLVGCCS